MPIVRHRPQHRKVQGRADFVRRVGPRSDREDSRPARGQTKGLNSSLAMGDPLQGRGQDENHVTSRPGEVQGRRANINASAISQHVDASHRVKGVAQLGAKDRQRRCRPLRRDGSQQRHRAVAQLLAMPENHIGDQSSPSGSRESGQTGLDRQFLADPNAAAVWVEFGDDGRAKSRPCQAQGVDGGRQPR